MNTRQTTDEAQSQDFAPARLAASAAEQADAGRTARILCELEQSERELRWLWHRLEPIPSSVLANCGRGAAALEQRIEDFKKSQQELRKLWRAVEQTPATVVIANAGGEIEYVNPMFVAVSGYSLIEVLGRNPRFLKSGQHAPSFYRNMWETLVRGDVWQGEICNKKKNGELYWESSTLSAVRDPAGEITHFVAIKVDITARKRAAEEFNQTVEALRRSERFLQSTLNALSAHIAILDERGFIVAVNAALEHDARRNRFLGADFAIGADYFELCSVAAADGSAEAPSLSRAIRAHLAGPTGEFLLEYSCPGQPEPEWFEARVVRVPGDGPVRVVVAHENITARKRAEAQLKRTQAELLAASRLAGMAEVASSVLHNVGNVLNSVSVSASLVADQVKHSKAAQLTRVVELLREHAADLGDYLTQDAKGRNVLPYLTQLARHLEQDQATLLREMASLRQNVEHVSHIVSAQQGCARIAGEVELVKMEDLLDDALRLNAGAMERHGVRLERPPAAAPLPELTVVKHKVLQILVNLLRNAGEACRQAGRPDSLVTVTQGCAGGRFQVTIADNGVGVAAENLNRLFTRGFTTRKDGHGFGLHSSRLAAREMGGDLHARSAGSGLGAVFTLELPLTPAAPTIEPHSVSTNPA